MDTEVREGTGAMLDGLVVAADAVEGLTELAVEHRPLQGSELPSGNPRVCGLRLAIEFQGLGVRGHAPRLVARLEQVGLGRLPVLGERVVVGQQARELVQAIAEQPLDRLRHRPVDGAPTFDQDAPVDRLLHQRVLEDVLELGQLPPQPDELGVLQLGQALVHAVAHLGDRPEDAQEEAAADHRRQLQDALDSLVQPVDPGHDHRLDRVRQRHRGERGGEAPVATPGIADERAIGDEGAEHLLDEEWVPAGLGEDLAADRVRQIARAGQVVDERPALVGAERRKRDLDRRGSAVRGRHGADARGRLGRLRPGREPDEQSVAARQRQQVLAQGNRRMVDPVPVLQHDRHRLLQGQPVEQLVHGEEHLAAERLGVEELHSLLALAGQLQRQHGGQVRQPLVRAGSEQIVRPLLELGPGLRLGIAGVDAEASLHDLDERPVAQIASEGQRAALEPEDSPRADATPGLGDQPRFTGAWLPLHDHHVTSPLGQRLHGDGQPRELMVAAHEWRADALRPAREARAALGPHPDQVVDLHGLGDAFQRLLAERLEVEVGPGGAMGRFAGADRARLRVLLQASGQVRGVADGRVVHAQVVADRSDHHGARVDAHAQANVADRPGLRRRPAQPLPDAGGRRSARRAWSSCATGAPNRAMNPSPRNWLIVPS